MWRNRIQLPSNQKLQGETCQPSPHATSQKANIQGPRSQGTLGCMDMLADMEERGNKITQDTLSALKSRRTPPPLLLEVLSEEAPRRAIHWVATNFRLYRQPHLLLTVSRCHFDKVGHNQSSGGRNPSQNRMDPASGLCPRGGSA